MQVKQEHQRQKSFDEFSFNQSHPLKTLVRLYEGQHRNLILAVIFYVIKHSPVWVLPIVSANIINIVSNPEQSSLQTLVTNVIVMIFLLLQNIPAHTMYVRFLSKAVWSVQTRLRSAMVRRLQQLSISYHNDSQSGRLQTKVLRDVEAVEMLSHQLINGFASGTISIVVAFTYTLSKNPLIAMFYVLTIPVASVLVYMFRGKMKSQNREFRQEIENMTASVSETIDMIPLTRAHGLETVEIKKTDSALDKVRDKGFRLDILNAVFGSSAWVVFQVFQVLCLLLTGYMAYKKMIPAGDIVLYQGFFNTIISAVSNMINIYPQLAKGMESINSIGEIMANEDIEDNIGKKQVTAVAGEFKFENLYFSYVEEHAVRNFNLEVQKGESIALVGASGAGKSTVLNLIIGLQQPTSGRVLLDGQDMSTLDLRTYRRHIAVVPQNTLLFSGSIKDNITYGLEDVSEERFNRVLEMSNAKEFIEQLPEGADTLIGEHGNRLSGGQRQRIAIARALVRDPQIIILDEATSALDSISEYQVQLAIQELIKGRTTFIVAHRLSTIRNVDRIVVMKDGSCVEVGTYKELIELDGEFRKLKELQV